jgi:hypothetical protein
VKGKAINRKYIYMYVYKSFDLEENETGTY